MTTKLFLLVFLFTVHKTLSCDLFDPDDDIPYSTVVCTNLTSFDFIPSVPKYQNVDQVLQVTQSQIDHIPKSAFSKLTSISKLNLSQNHILYTVPGSFNGLTNLTELYLDLNKLSEVSSGVYTSLTKLQILNLANNRIRFIVDSAFDGLLFLTDINLENNQIREVQGHLFDSQKQLQLLDLSGNLISLIEKDTFRNLGVLQILYLENNRISEIDAELFTDLIDLKYLDLSYNNIQNVQNGTFDNLFQLKVLNISHNRIKVLHEEDFLYVVSLEELVINNNQISALNVDVLVNYKGQLRVVALDHNAWDCENLAKIYVSLMGNHSISIPGGSEEGENFFGIACTSHMNDSLDGIQKNSTFFPFFGEDYRRSEFFKFVDNYRKSEFRREKLVAAEGPDRNVNDTLLLLSVGVQKIIILLVLLGFFWKKNRNF